MTYTNFGLTNSPTSTTDWLLKCVNTVKKNEKPEWTIKVKTALIQIDTSKKRSKQL